jgi:hypothetical protein
LTRPSRTYARRTKARQFIVHFEKGMSGAVVLLSDGKPVE